MAESADEERKPESQFETRAIHAGQEPDQATGALTTPIYQTSTYVQDAIGRPRGGFEYSRTQNPTRLALERCLADLEGAAYGAAFASGMAAIETIMHFLPEEARVVCVSDVYGGSYRLFARVYEPRGYHFEYLSAQEMNESLGEHLAGVHLVWVETPTNPLLSIVDIARVAAAAREHPEAGPMGPLVAVDNTFATPYLQRPLELGAHLVVHSTSKYLAGHADVIGGFVATRDPILAERLHFLQNALGAVPGPFDCWLTLRGLKTLALRMQRHSENARAIAEYLAAHPRVKSVLYPGLPEHVGEDVAARQMRDFGGMVSFSLASEAEAVQVCERTRVFRLAESLGSVESLIEHPRRMTHASAVEGPFAAAPELVRLSVGIEAIADLIADLEQALS